VFYIASAMQGLPLSSPKKLAPRALTGPKSTSCPNLPLETIYASKMKTSQQSSTPENIAVQLTKSEINKLC
jgi:hypothetical protein